MAMRVSTAALQSQQEDSPLIMRVHLVKWVCSGSFTAEICRQEEQQKDIQHMWADISSCYDSHRCSVKKEAWVWLQSGLQMCSHCGQVKAVYRLLLRVLHSNVGQQISLSQFYSNITFHTVSDSVAGCAAPALRLTAEHLVSLICYNLRAVGGGVN